MSQSVARAVFIVGDEVLASSKLGPASVFAAETPSDDQAKDVSATHGRIRPTMMACRPYSVQAAEQPTSARPSAAERVGGLGDAGRQQCSKMDVATTSDTNEYPIRCSGGDGVLVV
jgi:hypothetical protein